jgi:hypothetical protein
MNAEHAEVRERIERAFAGTPRPAGELVATTYDDEGVSAYFAGKSWRGHPVSDLRLHEVALCFFTPEAFRYYLPAFMLASLEDPEVADVIPQSIIGALARRGESSRLRVNAFSREEAGAVMAFLRTLVGFTDDADIELAMGELERGRPRAGD